MANFKMEIENAVVENSNVDFMLIDEKIHAIEGPLRAFLPKKCKVNLKVEVEVIEILEEEKPF